MKKTFLGIIIIAVLTWVMCSALHGVRTGAEGLWMISAIKEPGKMAIAEIQTDLNEGRTDLAKKKLQVLMDTWQRFDKGPGFCSGPGIGDIMVAFSRIDTNSEPANLHR